MSQKAKTWLGLLLISIIAYLDYHFFTEGYAVRKMSPIIRQGGHLVILIAMIPVGYWALKNHPLHWASKVWLRAYAGVLIFIVTIGAIQRFTRLFGNVFLDKIQELRSFFCSPLPYLFIIILYILSSRASK